MRKSLLSIASAFLLAGSAFAQITPAEVATGYAGSIYISLGEPITDETEPMPDATLVELAKGTAEGTIDFELKNFGFGGMSLGNISLPGIAISEQEGKVVFGENPQVDFNFLGGQIVAKANLNVDESYIKGDSLVAKVDVVWIMGEGAEMPINVLIKGSVATQPLNGNFSGTPIEGTPWDSEHGYFSWETLSGNEEYWGSAAYQRDRYVQPTGWVTSHVIGMNGLGATCVGDFVNEEESGNVSYKLTNRPNPFMATQIVPGYLSLGTTWATASVMDLANSADGGVFGGMRFTKRPDAVAFKYKRAHGTANAEEPATVVAYLWKGTYSQADVPGSTAFAAPPAVTMVDRDRNILGLPTTMGGEVTKTDDAALVASVTELIQGDAAEWTEHVTPLTYAEADLVPEKLNLIFAAGDYFGDRTKLGAENSFEIDDVHFVYYHELSALSYAGAQLDFDPAKLSYELPGVNYKASDVSFTKKGAGAKVTTSFDEETFVLTIRVEADNIADDPTALTVYTVKFGGINTGISSIETAPGADEVYTLSGIRVNPAQQLTKGVYIVGGKKVVVK